MYQRELITMRRHTMFFFSINKTGKNIPVYSSTGWNDYGMKQIGVLYDREAFAFQPGEIGCGFYFSDPSGKLTLGYHPLTNQDGSLVSFRVSDCLDFAYDVETIGGKKHWIFKFRRNEEVYKPDGSRWGTVAAGMRVATRSSTCGYTHWDWMQINYVERSTDHKWIPVRGANYEYGFVDTGLNVSSFPSSISMYGKW